MLSADRAVARKEILGLCERSGRGSKWLLRQLAIYQGAGKPENLETASKEEILAACRDDILVYLLSRARENLGFHLPARERLQALYYLIGAILPRAYDPTELTKWLIELIENIGQGELEIQFSPEMSVDKILSITPDDVLERLEGLCFVLQTGYAREINKIVAVEVKIPVDLEKVVFEEIYPSRSFALTDEVKVVKPRIIPGAEVNALAQTADFWSGMVFTFAKDASIAVSAHVAMSYLIDKIKKNPTKIRVLRIGGRRVNPSSNDDIAKAFLREIE